MAAPKLLSRDAILDHDDAVFENVAVPEWGGYVRVKGMSGEQRDAWERSIIKRNKDGSTETDYVDFHAKLVARVCVDDKGARMFTNDDVKALSRKSSVALQRVFDAGMRLSGLSKDDVKKLEGNSDAQSDDSTSD
jgi:hypothetical protein